MARKRKTDARQRDALPPHAATTTAQRDPAVRSAPPLRAPGRVRLFALLAAVCLVAAAGYVGWAVLRQRSAPAVATGVPVSAGGPSAVAALRDRPHLMFRSTGGEGAEGKVALVAASAPGGPRTPTALACDRVYAAGGQGICLVRGSGLVARHTGFLFGPDLRPRHRFDLPGVPSRARVSPDGRYAAYTVFVTGHSYAGGDFSTQTAILETATGRRLGQLEEWAVTRDGRRFKEVDFNFWGVTFARDSNRFYATVASGGRTYLVEGDVARRTARVLRENVECPSLSPDNARIAYKKEVGEGDRTVWRFTVLDLRTLEETPLTGETRSVDDQAEWLDDDRIAYGVPQDAPFGVVAADVWELPADGTGTPRLLIPSADSPVAVR